MTEPSPPHPRTPPDPANAGDSNIRLAPGVFVREGDLVFKAVRSTGPGGQNVNKRATKVELRVELDALPLPRDARARLRRLAGRRVNAAGELLITSDEERSQRRNRDACVARLRELVTRALVRPKPRVPTKPTRGSRERRLDAKRQRGQAKQRRRGVDHGDE